MAWDEGYIYVSSWICVCMCRFVLRLSLRSSFLRLWSTGLAFHLLLVISSSECVCIVVSYT